MKKLVLAFLLLSMVHPAAGPASAAPLYFPHIVTSTPWQTEIALINTGPDQSVTGALSAFSDEGQLVETRNITLAGHGRRQMIVADEFINHTNIAYIVFDADADTVRGYTKFYRAGHYRAAIPAVQEVNTSDIHIPHIASDAQWWTGVSLVNTTAATKQLTIAFNNGQSRLVTLHANQHRAFDIAQEFFNNQPQPDIQSAVITNAGGVIGLGLFGTTGGGNQLEGILLTDKTASTIYYPHVAVDGWRTGMVAYNPSALACTITITPYDAQGVSLAPLTRSLAGKEKYIGAVSDLGLPVQTSWFRVDATSPITGLELFSTVDGNRLAAYAGGGGDAAMTGVFAKIEKNGWTGIAFVNTEDNTASVALTAYDDHGTAVAARTLSVGGHARVVSAAEAIFPQDISGATYIAYSSDRAIAGFQINGAADGVMLDALPGLTGNKTAKPEYLVLISLDGCRPEYLDLAPLPNLKVLRDSGTDFSGAWVGSLQSNTPPGHTVMATGCFPARNGIIGFSWKDSDTGERYNPTTLEAIEAGQYDQIVAQKGVPTLAALVKNRFPGAVVAGASARKYYAVQGLCVGPADYVLWADVSPADRKLLQPKALAGHTPPADWLADTRLNVRMAEPGDENRFPVAAGQVFLEKARPRALLLNLPATDGEGHRTGGMADPAAMKRVMETTDAAVGALMDAYRAAGIFDKTLWVVTSDHGMTAGIHRVDGNATAAVFARAGIRGNVNLPYAYLQDPSQAATAAQALAQGGVSGVLATYAKVKADGQWRYQPSAATAAGLKHDLNSAYLKLLETVQGPWGPDMVACVPEETLFRNDMAGGHAELNWGDQHIPLFFAGPGVKRGAGSEAPARLVDLLPTIARLMGLASSNMDGVVLADALEAPTDAEAERARSALDPLRPLVTALRQLPPWQGGSSAGFETMSFTFDYLPGRPDIAGQPTMGTETMRFVSHGGKLYAAQGSWMEDYEAAAFQGPQILRKDGPDAPWRVELTFGPNYLRTECAAVLKLTTDAAGRVLATPLEALVAGPSDVSRTGERWATLWMRDDATGRWEASRVAREPKGAGVRSLGSHVDRITGIHHVFAGISEGSIHRGVYDPVSPGRLRWEAQPELAGTGRAMAFAEANGVLYAACGLEKDATGQVRGGLFRRIDGPAPSWELVYRWPYLETKTGDEARILRGLTAVPDPLGQGHEVLIGTRSHPGVVERIDPLAGHAVTVELDIKEYFRGVWGLTEYNKATLCAYNRLTPVLHPDTGCRAHLLGLWAEHPQTGKAPYNGSRYLVRALDGAYTHGEIIDPVRPVPDGYSLRGCRDLEPSPFPEDQGRVVYGGGYDCAGLSSRNTAWIYKGRLQ